jgi:hypothetical protein
MCSCDEQIGNRFLPHQLKNGTDYETKERIPVTSGFLPRICRECRGLSPEAHPMASTPRRTTKIRRYYWRELWFREMELFAEWADAHGVSLDNAVSEEAALARKDAAKRALDEIKQLHVRSPKYIFDEESQADVIQRYNVKIVDLKGIFYDPVQGQRVQIVGDNGEPLSSEEYVRQHYSNLGYESMFVESTPFHVLFGVFMWLVIQDVTDPRVRIVGFGDRASSDTGGPGHLVRTALPEDFGSVGYSSRRTEAIENHFSEMLGEDADPQFLFRYWLFHSKGLREYLWAHRAEDIETARRLVEILPWTTVRRILRYLIESYWQRYLGWPDLLVFKEDDFFFAEVKASTDKLSDAQKDWIRGNHDILKLPFVVVKIHRSNGRSGFRTMDK